jgi:hypothetical protein
MSQFTSTVEKTVQFDGDQVKVVLRRLKNKHTILLSPHIRPADSSGDVKVSFAEFAELAEKAERILPDCVVSMSGLVDQAGRELAVVDIISEAYFSSLLVSLLTELMLLSSPRAEAKKSGAPLPEPSMAPEA